MTVPQNPAVQGGAPAPVRDTRPVDDRIADVAQGFLAELDANPDPDLEPQEAPPVEAQEQPEEPPEAETPPPEIPLAEIEFDGEKFSVPEKLRGRFMADKDYRQKTMELSAQRKEVEQLSATARNLTAQAQQMAPYHAQLMMMDNRQAYLVQQMQQAKANSDPLAFSEAQGELGILLHQKSELSNGLKAEQQRLDAQMNEVRARQLALDAPKLFEQVPELGNVETRHKLSQFARDEGLPHEALEFLNWSAAGTKLVWMAHQYTVQKAEQEKAQKKLKEQVKTLPSAGPSSRAADPGANDKQLRGQWQKRGGKINDPAFDQYLRSKLRSK